MNRLERLLDAGFGEDRAAELAGLPARHVALIAAGVREARRAAADAALAADKARRAEQRRNRRLDADQVAAGSLGMLRGLAGRGRRGDLMAAGLLYRLLMHEGPALLALMVGGLRAEGYSDTEIGEALGITRQAVEGRWGPRGNHGHPVVGKGAAGRQRTLTAGPAGAAGVNGDGRPA